MNLLDENIRDDQETLLRQWRIPFRRIGRDLFEIGTTDENILPQLRRGRRATLFTQDLDFFKRELCHSAYALVFLDVKYKEVAEYIRRFLKHPSFDTQIKRMGVVARVQPNGIRFWRKSDRSLQVLRW